jgi:hypothetical protein
VRELTDGSAQDPRGPEAAPGSLQPHPSAGWLRISPTHQVKGGTHGSEDVQGTRQGRQFVRAGVTAAEIAPLGKEVSGAA